MNNNNCIPNLIRLEVMPDKRHDQTGEVDFAEHARIGREHIGGYVERGTEIIPQHDTCHVE